MSIIAVSSQDKILKAMQSDIDRKWMIKDFVKWEYFVWYEAGTRIGDLVRTGYVESEKVEGSHFCTYSLTDKGLEYVPDKQKTYTVAEDKSYIFEKETFFQSIYRKFF